MRDRHRDRILTPSRRPRASPRTVLCTAVLLGCAAAAPEPEPWQPVEVTTMTLPAVAPVPVRAATPALRGVGEPCTEDDACGDDLVCVPNGEPSGARVCAASPRRPSSAGLLQGLGSTGGELILPAPIAYETGKAQLKTESGAMLEQVLLYLRIRPEVTLLRIEVHTDAQGSAAANQALSEKRALAVARWLVGLYRHVQGVVRAAAA